MAQSLLSKPGFAEAVAQYVARQTEEEVMEALNEMVKPAKRKYTEAEREVSDALHEMLTGGGGAGVPRARQANDEAGERVRTEAEREVVDALDEMLKGVTKVKTQSAGKEQPEKAKRMLTWKLARAEDDDGQQPLLIVNVVRCDKCCCPSESG
jgi:hypothetical protein